MEKNDWVDFLAARKEVRSNTSVCLSVVHEKVKALPKDARAKFLKDVAGELGKKKIAYDINSYKDAPPGFRFWCGPTVEPADVAAALAELEKAFRQKVAAL